jgi:isopentenyl-diphosphate delta-isomerase
MINAMTGGFDHAVEINGNLSKLAASFNIPMAVGSQAIAVNDPSYAPSFKVVRDNLDSGVVIANINGFATIDEVKYAVEMVRADGIQIHLNPAQEMCMPEGDRDFSGILKKIEHIVRELNQPVIIKEVGFGLSKAVTKQLIEVGVTYIDIGGGGGTNFIKIESARNEAFDYPELSEWGIPTALSLLENSQLDAKLNIICSGGMRSADEVVKALCVGANMIGISGPILRVLMEEGYDSAHAYIENIIYKSKVIMLLLGKKDILSLREVPYRLKGELNSLVGDSR